jgi:ATP-binding cassette, subfamily B, multidrug efflux pump
MNPSTYQDEKVQSKIKLHQLFFALWPFMKKNPWLLTGALTFTLVHILSARLLPVTIGFAIDQGVLEKNLSFFLKAALFYSILQITFTISQFLYTFFFARIGNKAVFRLRQKLFQHLQTLPLSYFHQNPTGRLVNRLTSDPNTLQEIFTDGLIYMGIQFFVLFSIAVSMLLISFKMTIIALFSIPFFIWLSLKVTTKMRLHQRESKKQIGSLSAFITERLQGLKTLQVLNVIPKTFEHFYDLSKQYEGVTLNVIKSGARLQPVLNMVTAVVLSSLLIASGFFTSQEALSLGAVTTLILHAQDLIHPLRDILERYQQFQNSLTSAERVFPILEETPECDFFKNKKEFKTTQSSQNGEIVLDQVSFRYQPSGPFILNAVNLRIPSGSKIALVGKTGSGKSTLISLLQGFYQPESGCIYINGIPQKNLSLEFIRKQIGVIQQDPFVFRGTFQDNITVGNPHFSPAFILETLKQLDLAEDFQSRGMDLNFWIDEKGHNLSLGERQLLNFVRIFLFNPPILVLDEASANMDSETEVILQKALKQAAKGRTTIMIAHRLSTLQECDHIYLVSNGQLTTTTIEAIEKDPSLLS